MKKLAIIGTNGIPSKYGGFETLVEYLADVLTEKYDITVYCSSPSYPDKLPMYKGCKLEYISFKANGWQSIPYDISSLIHATRGNFDKILILGCSGGIIMPFLTRYSDKFIFNFGGLDWQRSKWNIVTKKFLKLSESLSIRYSGHLISDNKGIQEYIHNEYKRESVMIPYGGDQVFKVEPDASDIIKYPFLNKPYAFTVARIQPDNNIDMLLESFVNGSPVPFVFVGNWNSCTYGVKIKSKYNNFQNIILLDAIYDQRELNLLRSNCALYLHGHSAGGTNPALVEAMNLALPVFAYNCIFNKYTTDHMAEYFSSSEELSNKIKNLDKMDLPGIGNRMYDIARNMYKWEIIAREYSDVIDK